MPATMPTIRQVISDIWNTTSQPMKERGLPGTIRSTTTGDLLYANAPTGSSIPLGMEANQDDGEAALMEVLRQYLANGGQI